MAVKIKDGLLFLRSMEKDIEWALSHCRDEGKYPDIFPLDYGLDIVLENNPELTVCARNPRRVKIEIASFAGIAAGAVHYYPSLKADGIAFKGTKEDGTAYKTFGYISEEFSKKEKEAGGKYDVVYKIMITRPVTEEEIKKNPSAWEFYEPGDPTDRFESYDEAYNLALEVAKLRFPGWEIVKD